MAFKLDPQGVGAFWSATVLAGLCLVLVLINGVLALNNETARLQVNRRQLAINSSVQEARQNQDLIQMLAMASARSNDTAIRDLLARNGVTFVVNQPGQPATGAAAPPAGAANAPAPKP
jgi:hypothetical protein